jgi:glycosyltransferase involved in cell wall biosynthesis
MRFVCITYTKKPGYDQPAAWLYRIRAYMGILDALAVNHTVISIDRINYTGELIQNGVRHLFPDVGDNRLTAPRKLNRLIKTLDPDIVFVQGMIFPLQVIQLKMQLGKKVKIIVQNHAEQPGRRHNKLFQRIADRCIDAYLFAAKEMGEAWVRQGIIGHSEKIHEVMEVSSVFHPIDREQARVETAAQGKPVFLWVGRLDENKNPLMVIRSFLRFTRSYPDARLYMIYHTMELLDEIERLLDAAAGSRQSIVLAGTRPHALLGPWYSSADFIISGSWYEGSGAAVCEAMSCGCIPIVTDISSFRMMTREGRFGLLYKAGDEEALFAALMATSEMNSSDERGKVLEQFRSTLSFQAIAGKIQEITASL